MAVTDAYRRQHDELVEVVVQISGKLEEFSLANGGAGPVAELLKSLAGKLIVHLASEDHALYPKMIASADGDISAAAKKFQSEMGGLKSAFEGYYAKWANSKSIADNPAAFIEQTKGVFDALGQRVEKENTILYPLADRL